MALLSSTAPGPTHVDAAARSALIRQLQDAAPAGVRVLSHDSEARLTELTQALLDVSRLDAEREYERFIGVRRRGLQLDGDALTAQLGGATVLVTGGTGCIGSSVLRELTKCGPARIVSISRGVTTPWSLVRGVDYRTVDLRDSRALHDVIAEVRPSVVYHLAAQHDPGLAELEVHRTLTTNIFGTRNLIEAAGDNGVETLVYSSTGKAMRPFTPDVYAASKKAGEWLMSEAGRSSGMKCAAVRFTHVVDNSIIFERLHQWIADGSAIRLHAPEILFYLQSALESAHLLIDAGLAARTGSLPTHAIRDLEAPIDLTSLALGALGARQTVRPIHFCGYESGYEETPYPGLYDPRYSGDLSPLVNSFEAPAAAPGSSCDQVDEFSLDIPTTGCLRTLTDQLETACDHDAPEAVLKEMMRALSWTMLDARLGALPAPTLHRAAERARRDPSPAGSIEIHRLTNDAIFRAESRLN